MKRTHAKFVSGLFALTLASASPAETTIDPESECTRAVQFELGDTQFQPGDSITILEVRGSANLIQSGGTYCVKGTYNLVSQDEASLSLFATTANRTPTPVDPAQTMRVAKGTGSFSLVKRMSEDGYLHVSFYSRSGGQAFGGVYFGQGQWVLRDKHLDHHSSVTHSSSENTTVISTDGPNQVLFNFLGNPVAAPTSMDPAYTKSGLIQAMGTAAKNAGASLLKLEIDDSEFPFLVGIKFAAPDDKPKIIEQIRKMAAYKTSGGVGGEETYAMNIVPYQAFPSGASQRIYRRMTLREAVLHERLLSAP